MVADGQNVALCVFRPLRNSYVLFCLSLRGSELSTDHYVELSVEQASLPLNEYEND